MVNDRTFPISSNTTSVKSEDYTNKSLQMDSNLATMEMSGASCSMRIFCQKSQAISDETSDKSPAIESSDQTKAAKLEPLVYRVEEIAQLWRFLLALRTTCATPRRISGCCASAPASG